MGKYNYDVGIYMGCFVCCKADRLSSKPSSRPYDLKTKSGRDNTIRWYYANQSQQNRKQMLNRLYAVCDVPFAHEEMVMKSNFDLMRERISVYMKYVMENGLNEL